MNRHKIVLDIENDAMHLWIHEKFYFPLDCEIYEDSPQWEEMEEAYYKMLDEKNYEENLRWYEDHSNEDIHSTFESAFNGLHNSVVSQKNTLFGEDKVYLKMAYVYSVTLFETMIGDIIKYAVMNKAHVMDRVANRIDELNRNKKYTIKEMHSYAGGVKGIVMEVLASLTFHNAETTKKLVKIICAKNDLELNLDKVLEVIQKRHDYVHRNGKTLNDSEVDISKKMVLEDMVALGEFANEVYGYISYAINEDLA